MNRLTKNFERASFVLLALAMCGIEARWPFGSLWRHVTTEVLAGVFSLGVGFWIGLDVKKWSLTALGNMVTATQDALDDEESAHQKEVEAHEETITLLRAIALPEQPLEEARAYLQKLDRERYESETEGDVH